MSAESTVFVVDDDEKALNSMRWLLESDDLAVETYSSAINFLACYSRQRPGCLVLDLCMPGMDGLKLQAELLSRGEGPPIIFLSGHGNVSHCAGAMKAGAVDFLEKPADGGRILNVVHEALEKDRRRRSTEAAAREAAARVERLTPREREVASRLYEGHSIKAIAARFDISYQTVAKHRARVLEKLEIENETELVRLLANCPLDD